MQVSSSTGEHVKQDDYYSDYYADDEGGHQHVRGSHKGPLLPTTTTSVRSIISPIPKASESSQSDQDSAVEEALKKVGSPPLSVLIRPRRSRRHAADPVAAVAVPYSHESNEPKIVGYEKRRPFFPVTEKVTEKATEKATAKPEHF